MGFIGSAINAISQSATNMRNAEMTHETNVYNKRIADEANALTYKMFTEQNDWNLARRDEEWAYNDPSAQMERYMKAGINPLWAISNGNPGNAQQLTSASPNPPSVASMVAPQYQAPQVQLDEVAALQSVINGYQGFQRLALEKRQTAANIGKTEAETDLIKSQTISQDFLNSINLDTYAAQVGSIVQRYENLKSEGNLTEAEIEKSKALKEQAIAATSKTEAETIDIIDNISRQWRALEIQQQQADSSSLQARSSWMSAQTQDAALSHQIEKDQKEFELQSNDQILRVMETNRSQLDKWIGTGVGLSNLVSGNGNLSRTLSAIKVGAQTIYNRFYNNPTKTNLDAVNKVQSMIKSFRGNLPMPDMPLDASSSSATIVNPSAPWQQ